MTTMISEFVAAGLFDGVDGDDSRITKMEKAAENLATELKDNPPKLIRAILAGIDPDIPEEDPAIQEAMAALENEWKAVRTVYTDTPVNLLRAILIEACAQSTDDKNSSVLWLTLADTLPLINFGNEWSSINEFIMELAKCSEELAITIPSIKKSQKKRNLKSEGVTVSGVTVNRKVLTAKVGAALGVTDTGQAGNYETNQYLPNSPQAWVDVCAESLSEHLADTLDSVSKTMASNQTESNKDLLAMVVENINQQRLWVQDIASFIDVKSQAEQTRLDALWWSEALYSPSITKSYRELPLEIAAVSMAIDLVNIVAKPTPASVGYLLAESVNKLPEAGFSKEYKLFEVLNKIRESRRNIPEDWAAALGPPPKEGRLSIRDLFISALTQENWDTNHAMSQAGIRDDYGMSYPQLAHALFRQEQAVQLAGA